MEYSVNITPEHIQAWWSEERLEKRLRYNQSQYFDLWNEVLVVMNHRDNVSLQTFRMLYEHARDSDERVRVVDWFLPDTYWMSDEGFVNWIREEAAIDPEVRRALELYEIYL